MRLRVGTGPEVVEPDEGTIEQAIRSLLGAQEAFAILENSDGDYVQAMRGDAYTGERRLRQKLLVEYRDGSVMRHYRLTDLSIDVALRIFQLYRSGTGALKDYFPWKDVSKEFRPLMEEHEVAEAALRAAAGIPDVQMARALPSFTILAPNTPQQCVVVCLRCNVPCELQRPGFLNRATRTLLAGGIGFFAGALDSWWRCHRCGKRYRQADFKKGRIQQQRYTGQAMPTFEPR
jgi:hypothetical protein